MRAMTQVPNSWPFSPTTQCVILRPIKGKAVNGRPKRRNIGLVNWNLSTSPLSCCPGRQDRRPTRPVCHRPGRFAAAFRKGACSTKRAYWPANRPFPARVRTTNLGPFGEVIRQTGPMAKANPIRFSTKYQDDESDLLYYGYRFYKPSTGTWSSRDPIEEHGGKNIYAFVQNNPVGHIDVLGQHINVHNHTTDVGCEKYRVERVILDDTHYGIPSYLIQQITLSVKIYSYFAGALFQSYSYSDQYWEAFGPFYDPNETIGAPDIWFWDPGSSDAGNSLGSITEIGVVKLFSLGTTGYLGTVGQPGPIEWVPPADPSSGEVPSTKHEPSWWNRPDKPPLDGPTSSSATLIWNCSCSASSYQLLLTPPSE